MMLTLWRQRPLLSWMSLNCWIIIIIMWCRLYRPLAVRLFYRLIGGNSFRSYRNVFWAKRRGSVLSLSGWTSGHRLTINLFPRNCDRPTDWRRVLSSKEQNLPDSFCTSYTLLRLLCDGLTRSPFSFCFCLCLCLCLCICFCLCSCHCLFRYLFFLSNHQNLYVEFQVTHREDQLYSILGLVSSLKPLN